MNAWLAFEPWIMVWQLTHGVALFDPASNP